MSSHPANNAFGNKYFVAGINCSTSTRVQAPVPVPNGIIVYVLLGYRILQIWSGWQPAKKNWTVQWTSEAKFPEGVLPNVQLPSTKECVSISNRMDLNALAPTQRSFAISNTADSNQLWTRQQSLTVHILHHAVQHNIHLTQSLTIPTTATHTHQHVLFAYK